MMVLWQPIKEVFHEKHRFVVMDTKTYQEKFSFQLSGLNLFVTVGISIIVLVALTSVIIAFTPLREFIPGYANSQMVEQTYRNAHVIDSLERQLDYQASRVATLKTYLSDGEFAGEELYNGKDTASKVSAVSYTHSKADSTLRREVERADNKYQLRDNGSSRKSDASCEAKGSRIHAVSEQIGLGSHLLSPPLKGKVIGSYDAKIKHYGADIAAAHNAVVVSVYGGTVLFSNYTVETGYVIAIQHQGNVVSVYRHCSALLKQQGDVVRVGEPIAYLGNSGRLTSGPHLHFELWIAGKAVDPVQYIPF